MSCCFPYAITLQALQVAISVLLIESNDDLRDMCSLILSDAGYVVRSVRIAPEAVAAIFEARPDVAVLEPSIPGGATEVMAALHPTMESGGGERVPLVWSSGARDAHEDASALGAVHLAKPFAPAELIKAVERALSRPRVTIVIR